MNDRDFEANPYSKDEQRVAEYLSSFGVGGGDDPIGFILASHALAVDCIKAVNEKLDIALKRETNPKLIKELITPW